MVGEWSPRNASPNPTLMGNGRRTEQCWQLQLQPPAKCTWCSRVNKVLCLTWTWPWHCGMKAVFTDFFFIYIRKRHLSKFLQPAAGITRPHAFWGSSSNLRFSANAMMEKSQWSFLLFSVQIQAVPAAGSTQLKELDMPLQRFKKQKLLLQVPLIHRLWMAELVWLVCTQM